MKSKRLDFLRHSHASLLIPKLGAQPKLVADRLGHEKIQTTLSTYSHLYPDQSRELTNQLEKLVETDEKREITEQILSGDFCLSEDGYKELKADYLAFVITMVDILNGAAYLFDKNSEIDNRYWKKQQKIQEYKAVLKEEFTDIERKNVNKNADGV